MYVLFQLQQRNAVDQNKPTTHTPNDSTNEAPVDSWEDITVTEDSSPTPDTSSNKTTKKATNPAVTSNTTVTTNTSSSSSSSSSSTCSSNSSPPQQHESSSNKVSERKTKDTEAAVHKSIRAIPHQAAPVKDVDEKENVNIVFIGHVGQLNVNTINEHGSVCIYMYMYVCTLYMYGSCLYILSVYLKFMV